MSNKDLSVPLINEIEHTNPILPEQTFLPDAYRLPEGELRAAQLSALPAVVFIEVTNRCNLLCLTCPRTHFDREPLKDLSLDEFIDIAEQFPQMRQAELHGIGEPLLNHQLPQIIRYLKGRGVKVVINSNGTLLNPRWQRELVESGLDVYRCSIDGAKPGTYARIRGANLLDKLIAGLSGLLETKARLQADNPYISIWCVATRENLEELPELVGLAASIGVPEVYLQRMVYFAHEPEEQRGMAIPDLAIFGVNGSGEDLELQEQVIAECERISQSLGIEFRASGARDARNSLAAARKPDYAPWQACMRPWTTAYVTANGNCLPCCISPFATHDYESLIMGNLSQQPFVDIWNNPKYQDWRKALLSTAPHKACAGCGVYWSL
jgi:MoaA/NifB/PqqE/SkfB family radical SAM enzyme